MCSCMGMCAHIVDPGLMTIPELKEELTRRGASVEPRARKAGTLSHTLDRSYLRYTSCRHAMPMGVIDLQSQLRALAAASSTIGNAPLTDTPSSSCAAAGVA